MVNGICLSDTKRSGVSGKQVTTVVETTAILFSPGYNVQTSEVHVRSQNYKNPPVNFAEQRCYFSPALRSPRWISRWPSNGKVGSFVNRVQKPPATCNRESDSTRGNPFSRWTKSDKTGRTETAAAHHIDFRHESAKKRLWQSQVLLQISRVESEVYWVPSSAKEGIGWTYKQPGSPPVTNYLLGVKVGLRD